MSINYKNKPLQERIAKACYFITAGAYSNSNVGQDTWNTWITTMQSHCNKKIAWANRNKWKEGLDSPDLSILEIINHTYYNSIISTLQLQHAKLPQITYIFESSSHVMQALIRAHWWKG